MTKNAARAPARTSALMRLRVAAIVLALLATSCAGPARPGAGGSDPESPVTSTPVSPGPADPPEPRLVEPSQGLVEPHPAALEGHEVLDERTLLLRFYSGVEACYGLVRVDVTYGEGAVTVLVFVGRVPSADLCIELAELVSTRVTLEEPLGGRKVVDGTKITEG